MASSSQGVAPDSQWRLKSKDLPRIRCLGKGLSGIIYETTWLGNRYTRKDFPLGSMKHNYVFEKEAKSLFDLHHPNIVQCFGYTIGKSSCSLLQEYVDDNLQNTMNKRIEARSKKSTSGGMSLESRVLDIEEIKRLVSGKVQEREETDVSLESIENAIIPFELPEAVDIILQIATAMEYLHDHGIAHGDLKSNNVLLEWESGVMKVKVADFGLIETKKRIKLVSKRARHLEILMWKAPERLEKLLGPLTMNSDELFTESDTNSDESGCYGNFKKSKLAMADVYSFGLTCLHILGEELMYSDLSLTQLRERRTMPGFQHNLPSVCPEYLELLICSTLEFEPLRRPTFSYIRTLLETFHLKHIPRPLEGDGKKFGNPLEEPLAYKLQDDERYKGLRVKLHPSPRSIKDRPINKGLYIRPRSRPVKNFKLKKREKDLQKGRLSQSSLEEENIYEGKILARKKHELRFLHRSPIEEKTRFATSSIPGRIAEHDSRTLTPATPLSERPYDIGNVDSQSDESEPLIRQQKTKIDDSRPFLRQRKSQTDDSRPFRQQNTNIYESRPLRQQKTKIDKGRPLKQQVTKTDENFNCCGRSLTHKGFRQKNNQYLSYQAWRDGWAVLREQHDLEMKQMKDMHMSLEEICHELKRMGSHREDASSGSPRHQAVDNRADGAPGLGQSRRHVTLNYPSYLENGRHQPNRRAKSVPKTSQNRGSGFTKENNFHVQDLYRSSRMSPSAALFEGTVQVQREYLRKFVGALIKYDKDRSPADGSEFERNNGLLRDVVERLLPHASFAKDWHFRYGIEAWLSRIALKEFGQPEEGGTRARARRIASWAEYQKLSLSNSVEAIVPTGEDYFQSFHLFCNDKFDTIQNELKWREEWPDHLVKDFLEAMKHVWQVHKLALAFDPVASQFNMKVPSPYDVQFMEPLEIRPALLKTDTLSPFTQQVGFFVNRGFIVGDRIIKCQVYLTPKVSSESS